MRKLTLTIEGQPFEIEIEQFRPGQGEFSVRVNGETLRVVLPNPESVGETDWVLVDDRPYRLQLDRDLQWLQVYPSVYHLELHESGEESGTPRPRSLDGPLKAPIPGAVTRLLVQPGQAVQAGQPLLVLEAMKMENEIRAPYSGVVRSIHARPGAAVKRGEDLIEIT